VKGEATEASASDSEIPACAAFKAPQSLALNILMQVINAIIIFWTFIKPAANPLNLEFITTTPAL
jgi:hypothetical protein